MATSSGGASETTAVCQNDWLPSSVMTFPRGLRFHRVTTLFARADVPICSASIPKHPTGWQCVKTPDRWCSTSVALLHNEVQSLLRRNVVENDHTQVRSLAWQIGHLRGTPITIKVKSSTMHPNYSSIRHENFNAFRNVSILVSSHRLDVLPSWDRRIKLRLLRVSLSRAQGEHLQQASSRTGNRVM